MKTEAWKNKRAEPAQALNVISGSLNRVGTGAEGLVGPPCGSQLSRPGAALGASLVPWAVSLPLTEEARTPVSGGEAGPASLRLLPYRKQDRCKGLFVHMLCALGRVPAPLWALFEHLSGEV